MLIKEWHTQLRQELNKINSALYDVLLPQEIDMAFNKNIEVYLNSKYSLKSNRKHEGLEQSEKRIDDLQTLITVYKNQAVLGNTFQNSFDYDNRAFLILPQDYRIKVATRVKSSLAPCNSTFSPQQSTIIYYIYGINLSNVTPFTDYGHLAIKTGPSSPATPSVADIFTPNAGLATYTIDDFNIVKTIITEGCNNAFKSTKPFYFEKFFGYYKKNYLLYISTTSLSSGTIPDYYKTTGTPGWDVFETLGQITEKTYLAQGETSVSSDKMVQHDDVYAMQADPFNKTVSDFPLAFFENGYYYVLYDKNNFVVNEIEMTYIRNPKTVSYYGDISCDLPEQTHQEIISLTAQYFLEEFEAQRTQSHQATVLTTE